MRAILAWLISAACCAAAAPSSAADDVDFERHVARILVSHCAGCHNASDPAGGLNLLQQATAVQGGDSELPAIVAGDVEHSNLLLRIQAGEMPPDGKGAKLSAAEVSQLEAWIRSGAVWPRERVLSPFEFTSESRGGRDWWSLDPPKRPAVPSVKHGEFVRHPIDAFVLAKLEQQGLEPSGEAPRATFIRRAMLDLHGLPPSREEIEHFVNDTSPDAYEKLVDGLLASPRYGERWARHWLDVVRFGESNGYETNTPRTNAWPYRDWVIAALNDDLPYPRFVLEQLAGDQVGADEATGFLVGGAHDVVGSPDIELTLQQRANDLNDIISTSSTAFLGLTVGCAECHDHKFDPIAQRDYYALEAVFAGVQHGQRELRDKDSPWRKQQEGQVREQLAALEQQTQRLAADHQPLALPGSSARALRPAVNTVLNVDRFAPVQARFARFTILATSQSEPCLDELEIFTVDEPPRNPALASAGAKATVSSVLAGGGSNLHQLAHINDGRYGNGRSWISAEAGSGWVQIELAQSETIDRVVWSRDRQRLLRDRLPTAYKIEVSDDGNSWHVVANSDDRKAYDPRAEPGALPTEGLPPEIAEQIASASAAANALRARLEEFAPRQVYAGTFIKPEPTHLLYRGEPLQKREQVSPGAIAAVGVPLGLTQSASDAERRLALARWIGSPRNPLTARVMVNRIWHYHFGQGLVRTPSDLGFNGGVPSHPELLDWLASDFMAQGWHAKAVHRAIMLSSTYRQSSQFNERAAAQDAGTRLLWRFPPRRLEAEPIRDCVLWTSGVLDLRMGGPGYDVFEPNTNYVKVYQPKQAFGPAEWRRMVYQDKPRMRQDGTFGEFDCPDSSQTTARRNVSTTALQALNLLNSSFVMQQAGLLAQRLEREAGGDPRAQAGRAFWLAFGRAAADDELAAAEALIGQQGLVVFCRAIYNANEFLYLD